MIHITQTVADTHANVHNVLSDTDFSARRWGGCFHLPWGVLARQTTYTICAHASKWYGSFVRSYSMRFTCGCESFSWTDIYVYVSVLQHRYQIEWSAIESISERHITSELYIEIVFRFLPMLSIFYFAHSYAISGTVSLNAIQIDQIMQCLFYHISVSSENHSHWTIK